MLLFLSQHCDQVIMNEYTGMSAKGEGRSQVYAQIVGEVVKVHPNHVAGLTVSFDKKPTQVSILVPGVFTLYCFDIIIDSEKRCARS